MIRWLAILGSALLPALARADEPAGAPFAGGFVDGSTVPLFLPGATLTLVTKYGTLAVPLSDIVRVEFGFRYPAGLEAKILAAAGELGGADYRGRESAQQRLLAWGELALPALRKTLATGNPEAVRRADETLARLRASLPKDRWDVPEYDVIVTETAAMRGAIQTDAIRANTKYFGERTLKLADLRALRNAALDPAAKPAAVGPSPPPLRSILR